ncbi:hypothetical protein C8A01DRAFT_40837 [Parachaetomium inaequale]|uniref:Uncharacterized protein n=1 Tax=Parachaetomium inaequale TaxID=2588326 RepID=A0AAN6P8F4_9PEZI|nr:hypothetical protein C8A01DRAFT_40837 [Parachaetomium inaequale]
MGEHSDEPEYTDDQMLIDEPQPFDGQRPATQVAAQERLATIQEQIRAEAHAHQLAELQRTSPPPSTTRPGIRTKSTDQPPTTNHKTTD